MITLTILISLIAFSFLPIVGAYIGFYQSIYGEKNKWQDDFSDAYLIKGGK